MDAVLRWRSPLTCVLTAFLVALATGVLVTVLTASDREVAAAEAAVGATVASLPVLASLVALVGWSVARPTRRSASLAAAVAVAASVSAAAAVVTAVVAWPALPATALIVVLAACALEVLALAALMTAGAHLRAATSSSAARPGPPVVADDELPAEDVDQQPGGEGAAAVRDEQPLWEIDEAAGAVWMTAADAAAGTAGRPAGRDDAGWSAPNVGPLALPAAPSPAANPGVPDLNGPERHGPNLKGPDPGHPYAPPERGWQAPPRSAADSRRVRDDREERPDWSLPPG